MRRQHRVRSSTRLLPPLLNALYVLLPLALVMPVAAGGLAADGAARIWAMICATLVALAALGAYCFIITRFLDSAGRPAKERREHLDEDLAQIAHPPAARQPISDAEPEVELPTADSILDRGLWKALREHLAAYPRTEQGGLLLGFRRDGRHIFQAAIIPPQLDANGARCEFEVEDVQHVVTARDTLPDTEAAEALGNITWLHTHPHLGVFLSQTDRSTFRSQWLGLDPSMRAVVVDVFEHGLERQVGAFDPALKPVRVALADVPLPAGAGERLRKAVDDTFRAAGRPAPTVLAALPAQADSPDEAAAEIALLLRDQPEAMRQRILDLVKRRVA